MLTPLPPLRPFDKDGVDLSEKLAVLESLEGTLITQPWIKSRKSSPRKKRNVSKPTVSSLLKATEKSPLHSLPKSVGQPLQEAVGQQSKEPVQVSVLPLGLEISERYDEHERVQTALMDITRQRDQLSLKCRHLHSLLHEAELTMNRQAKEIKVLRASLQPDKPKSKISDAPVPELLQLISSLRNELNLTRQTVKHAQEHPEESIKPFLDKKDQVIELDMPSLIVRKMNKTTRVNPTPTQIESDPVFITQSRSPIQNSQEQGVDELSFISDVAMDASYGSLLDEPEPSNISRLSSTPVPNAKKIFRSPSKEVILTMDSLDHEKTRWVPFVSPDTKVDPKSMMLFSPPTTGYAWHPSPDNIPRRVTPIPTTDRQSPTKSFVVHERDALELELLERYTSLRHLEHQYQADIQRRDNELNVLRAHLELRQ